jgi:hypothetical protein
LKEGQARWRKEHPQEFKVAVEKISRAMKEHPKLKEIVHKASLAAASVNQAKTQARAEEVLAELIIIISQQKVLRHVEVLRLMQEKFNRARSLVHRIIHLLEHRAQRV